MATCREVHVFGLYNVIFRGGEVRKSSQEEQFFFNWQEVMQINEDIEKPISDRCFLLSETILPFPSLRSTKIISRFLYLNQVESVRRAEGVHNVVGVSCCQISF